MADFSMMPVWVIKQKTGKENKKKHGQQHDLKWGQ
jgi:hypothetical protein